MLGMVLGSAELVMKTAQTPSQQGSRRMSDTHSQGDSTPLPSVAALPRQHWCCLQPGPPVGCL